MKHFYEILFIMVCLLLASMNCSADANIQKCDADGTLNSSGAYYAIQTADDLIWLSNQTDLTNGESEFSDLSAKWSADYVQTAHIDFGVDETLVDWNADGTVDGTGTSGFSPIGNGTAKFRGSYKGNGQTISNLYINRPSQDHIGMFGWSGIQELSNLGLVDCNIIGGPNNTGGLIGVNIGDGTGSVKNCFVTGTITGNGHELGGFIGDLQEGISIENCYVQASVRNNETSENIGGFVGAITGSGTIEVKNCYVVSSVVSSGTNVGAFVGNKSSGTISNCFYNSDEAGSILDNDAKSVTTAQMQDYAIYAVGATWDFMDETTNGSNDIWGINATQNDAYPFLSWQGYDHILTFSLCLKELSYITSNSATATYYITNPENIAVQQYGVCWNTSGEPTLDDNHTDDGDSSISTEFISSISGLSAVTQYYVRPYATTNNETIYGETVKFVSIFIGDGTEETPYQIRNTEDLIFLSQHSEFWSNHFMQTADIDFGEDEALVDWNADGDSTNDTEGFSPIGDNNKQFKGSYNGNGHTICNLYINRPTQIHIGLFGWSHIKGLSNLGLVDCNITGGPDNTGGILGVNYGGVGGVIENCFVTGTIVGNGSDVGGIIGDSNLEIEIRNCYSLASVENNSSLENTGGFIGSVRGSTTTIIENCYVVSSVVSSGTNVGAFVGNKSSGTISNCFYNSDEAGSILDNDAKSVTTAQMQDYAIYAVGATWDFMDETTNGSNDIWGINATQNDAYPFLSWQGYDHILTFSLCLNELSYVTSNSASATYYITNPENIAVQQYGVCWNTSGEPTLDDNHTDDGDSSISTEFISSISGLSAVTQYYLRPYATTNNETIYGETVEFVSTFIGDGTEETPYQIRNTEDLIFLSQHSEFWSNHFIQTADIDFGVDETMIDWNADGDSTNDTEGFSPIGNESINFTGSYDGGDFEIDGLYINRTSDAYSALFGYIETEENSVVIQNLGIGEHSHIENKSASGYSYAAGIVAYTAGALTLDNCYNRGTVTSSSSSYFNSSSYGGGLVAYAYSSSLSITNSYNSGTVTSSSYSNSSYGGGLVAYASTLSITNSYNSGTVSSSSSSSSSYGGGLVAMAYSSTSTLSITNSYASGSVLVNGTTTYRGGIAGKIDGSLTMSACYYDRETTGMGEAAINGATSDGITALSTEEFKGLSGFPLGTEDDNPWVANVNGRPYLYWQDLAISNGLNLGNFANGYTASAYVDIVDQNPSFSLSQTGFRYKVATDDAWSTIDAQQTTAGEFSVSFPESVDAANTILVQSYALGSDGFTYYGDAYQLYDNTYYGGSGTEADPYQIATTADLLKLSQSTAHWGQYFIQTADIDFGADEALVDWNGNGTVGEVDDNLGFSSLGDDSEQFSGSYNGDGHTISNLYINRPSQNHIGLFGWAKTTGISNLGLVDIDITGQTNVGGLIGVNYGGYSGEIENCFVIGNITGNGGDIGGLIGDSHLKLIIRNCYTNVAITKNGGYDNTGGFIGYVHDSDETLIENCYATASVSSSAGSNIYAFVGSFESGTISNCYFDSDEAGTVTDTYATELSTSDFATQTNFTEWAFDNDPNAAWYMGKDVNNTLRPILKWSAHTITYNLDGGTNHIENPSYYTGNGEIQLFNAELSNKFFYGWYTQSNLASASKIYAISADAVDTELWAKYVDPFPGTGTSDDPYQIASTDDLILLSNLTQIWDKHFIQTADIDFGGNETLVDWNGDGDHTNDTEGFSPIGSGSIQFRGTYDGDGHTISNLYINRPDQINIGLFGCAYMATIKKLGLVNCDITGGSHNVGSILGLNYDYNTGSETILIEECFATGTVTGYEHNVGGIIGNSHSKLSIRNCYAFVTVTNNGTGNATGGFIGGLKGQYAESSSIENCYAASQITGSGVENINAFIGYYIGGAISNCYFDRDIEGTLTDSHASAKTTTEMQTQSTYTDWDFMEETTNGAQNIWGINPTANGGYPFLAWQGYTHVGDDNTYNIWQGDEASAETDWNTAGNWSKTTVPVATDDVVIHTSSNAPIVSSSTAAVCNDLFMDEGASLTITSNASSSGSLQINGTVSGEGAANVSYERHMGSTNFQLVSTPLQGQDIGAFYETNKANIKTNGELIAIAPYCNHYAEPCWEFYTTDEGTNKASEAGSFEMGQGYEMLARGDNTATEENPVYTDDATLTFTGTPYTGDVDFAVTDGSSLGSGWNLIGNPYTTALCVNVQGNDNTNENSLLNINTGMLDSEHCAIYVWDYAADKYITVNESSDFCVAPGQAFFICDKVGNANISFTTAMRTADVELNFKSAKSLQPELKLIVSDGSTSHSTRIVLKDNCSDGMDRGWDAGRMPLSNKSLMVYTQLVSEESDLELDIQAISALSSESIIPVGITAAAGSEFTIGIEQQNIAEGTQLILEDRELGIFTDLSSTDARPCISTVSTDISGFGRYYLRLKNSTTAVDQRKLHISAIPFYNEEVIRINGIQEASNSTISLVSMQGQILKQQQSTQDHTIDMANMHCGIYMVIVENQGTRKVTKVMWK